MTMSGEPYNVIFAGVGGQGNVIASKITALAAVDRGLKVTVGETFGASQRGGTVMSHVRIFRGEKAVGPLIPAGMAHLIVGFEPLESLRILMLYGNKSTMLIVNDRPVYPLGVLAGDADYPDVGEMIRCMRDMAGRVEVVRATDLAFQAGGAMSANIVMVGALAGLNCLDIPAPVFENAIAGFFRPQFKEQNIKAFRLGMDAVTT
jgi:indolepyruvate ferredoxin oxidoreductase beta subunit